MTATALTAQPTGLVLPELFSRRVFEAVKDRILSKVPSARRYGSSSRAAITDRNLIATITSVLWLSPHIHGAKFASSLV